LYGSVVVALGVGEAKALLGAVLRKARNLTGHA
jgi:hypothetical protein